MTGYLVYTDTGAEEHVECGDGRVAIEEACDVDDGPLQVRGAQAVFGRSIVTGRFVVEDTASGPGW